MHSRNVLLIGYGPTIGDVGIGEATIQQIREICDDAEVLVLTDRPDLYAELPSLRGMRVEKMPEVPAYWPRDRWTRLRYYREVASVLRGAEPGRRWNELVAKHDSIARLADYHRWADLVIYQGGPHWNDRWLDEWTLRRRFILHAIARTAKAPVALCAHSFGPFKWRGIRKLKNLLMLRPILNSVEIISVRDRFSFSALRKLGIRKPKLVQASDIAWLLESYPPSDGSGVAAALSGRTSVRRVAVTLRAFQSHYGFDEDTQRRFRVELAAALDAMIDDGVEVWFVGTDYNTHEDRLNDIEVSEAVLRHIARKEGVRFVDEPLTPGELKWFYSRMDALMTVRMHSAIFAVGAGVPTVLIGYDQKSEDMARQAGLDEWFLKYDEVERETVLEMTRWLLSNKEPVSRRLRRSAAEAGASARHSIDALAPVLDEVVPVTQPELHALST